MQFDPETPMPKYLHPTAGVVALATISLFWLATAASELFLPNSAVVAVKTAIPWGFLVLVPALMAAGSTGLSLARGRRGGLIGAKLHRMPIIAANGLLVLMPAAFYLAWKAHAGAFDANFYLVQAIEIVAGATNITLLGQNMRDGLKMRRPHPA